MLYSFFTMGEIVIEIPTTTKRRYRLTNKTSVQSIIAALDATAVRVKGNPAKLTRQQLEDIEDGQLADEILRTNKRFYTIEEVEKHLGI